jgi:parallel beta-helix repeat protein
VRPLTGGPANITLSDNEISLNNSGGEYDVPGSMFQCGCSGGGKFWNVNGATISGNYVHDNKGPGIWVDTNNTGINITNNTIVKNYAEGIIMEVSYNFTITHNVLVDNAWTEGPMNGGKGGSAIGAIYISESGGDSRIPGINSGVALVSDNVLTDNWGGVEIWEDADRHCADGTKDGDSCTLVDPKTYTVASCMANLPTAVAGKQTGSPPADYYDGCRWKSQNVEVSNNTFNLTASNVPGCTVAALCSVNALYSQYGSFAPYVSSSVTTAITFNQNNVFKNNTYTGPWNFYVWSQGNLDNPIDFKTWQSPVTDKCGTSGEIQSGTCNSGFGQDQGSTISM